MAKYEKPTKEEAAALEAFKRAFALLPKDCHISIDTFPSSGMTMWRRDTRYGPHVTSAGQVGPILRLKRSQVDL